MGGLKDVAKADLPTSLKPKDWLRYNSLPGQIDARKKAWNTATKPLPYEGPVAKQEGPVVSTGAMSAEDEAAVKRRRRRPSTVLAAAGESDSLGG